MRQSSKTVTAAARDFLGKPRRRGVSRAIAPRSLPLRVRTANEFDPDFAVARDQQVRDPLQGVFADFKADFLVSQIHFDPKPLIFQEFSRLAARIRPVRR